MKDLDLLSLFLKIQFYFEGDCVTMHQSKYIAQMLAKFKMNVCKPKAAPYCMNVRTS